MTEYSTTDEQITQALEAAFPGVPVFVGYAAENEVDNLPDYNYFIISYVALDGDAGQYRQTLDIVRVYENQYQLDELKTIRVLQDIRLSFRNPKINYGQYRKGETDTILDMAAFQVWRGVYDGEC